MIGFGFETMQFIKNALKFWSLSLK